MGIFSGFGEGEVGGGEGGGVLSPSLPPNQTSSQSLKPSTPPLVDPQPEAPSWRGGGGLSSFLLGWGSGLGLRSLGLWCQLRDIATQYPPID